MNTPKSQMIDRLVRISRSGRITGRVMSRKTAEWTGAVDLGGLDEIARHLRKAGEQRDRHERDCTPHDQHRDEG